MLTLSTRVLFLGLMLPAVTVRSQSPRGTGPIGQRLSTTLSLPGGVAMPCPVGWTVREADGQQLLEPPRPPGGAATTQFVVRGLPRAGLPADARTLAAGLVEFLGQRIPDLGRPARTYALGAGGDGGVALVFQRPEGLSLHVLARVTGNVLILVLGAGAEADLAIHGPQVAAMLGQVAAAPVATPAAAPATAPRGAAPAPGLDPNLVATWRCGDGWADPRSGTSFATETVLDLRPDGTFTLGSRAAGGDRRNGLDTGFKVAASGRWSAANGVLRRVSDQDGAVVEVRYSFHDGKLVFHLGNRKYSFWSR